MLIWHYDFKLSNYIYRLTPKSDNSVSGKYNTRLVFQTDSNLCINSGPCDSKGNCKGYNIWCLGNKYWQSTINYMWKKYKGNIPNYLNIYLYLRDDGNVIINKDNNILWAIFGKFNGKNWSNIHNSSDISSTFKGNIPYWAEDGKLKNSINTNI